MVGIMCIFAGFTIEKICHGFQNKKYLTLLFLLPIIALLAYSLRLSERTIIRTNDFFNMGLLYKENNELERAEVFYKKSLGIMPQYKSAAQSLIRIYLQSGKMVEAEKIAKGQVRFNPHDLNMNTLLAISYIMEGKWGDADYLLKKLVARFPDHAKAYYYMGVLRIKQKRYEEALELFTKTIDLDNRIQEAHNNIASINKILESKKGASLQEHFPRP